MRRFHFLLLLLETVLIAPFGARAQDDSAAMENARAHMERGQAYYLQGRFGEAATEFEAAYEASPFGAFLYNAAVAYENAGDHRRAIEYFERYLERDPASSDRNAVEERVERLRAARAAAESGAAQADQVVAPESAPVPSAIPEDFKSLVSVRTEPNGATVIVSDGTREVARGLSPFSHTLDQSRYRIRIEHPDYNVAEQDIAIEPGKVYVVVVNLSQGEFFGYLRTVTDPPGAQVFIDDRSVGSRGTTPFEGPLTVGTHHLWLERPGYRTVERDVEVTIGDDVELRETMARVAFGRVRVIGNVRGARISIDGAVVGNVPWEGQVDAGARALRVSGDGMKDFERTIEVSQGQLTPIRVRLKPAVGRGPGWVSGAFSLAALGGGIACAILSDQVRQSMAADAANGTLSNRDSRHDEGFWLAVSADAAFGVALILAGVATYYFLYDPLPPSEGTVLEPRDWAFAPMLDPMRGSIGGAVSGRF